MDSENSLVIANNWNQEKVELLKRTICKGGSDDELDLFLAICKRTNLDPFQKQIYAVKRWDSKANREVMGAQTGIDGFRLIAQRSGKYDGQEGPFWCGPDAKWFDVWTKKEPPSASKVIIYKVGSTRGVSAVAHWNEYAQKKKDGGYIKQWNDMPALMLAKCAESLALRKAFPNETSGLYTVEEYPPPTEDKKPRPKDVTPEIEGVSDMTLESMRGLLFEIAKERNWPADKVTAVIKQRYHKSSTKDLNTDEIRDLSEFLKEKMPFEV